LVRDPFYVVDVVTIIEPVAGALTFGDAVRNVIAHPAKLFSAGLTFLSYCTHIIPSCFWLLYHLIVASLWLDACGLKLEAHQKISGNSSGMTPAAGHGHR